MEQLGKDTIVLGDINLDYKKWSQQGSHQQQLIDQVKDTQIRAAFTHMVHSETRFQLVDGVPHASAIDHVYTNHPDKLKEVQVLSVGDSDHLGQVVTKLTSIPQDHPQTYRVRQHKPTSVEYRMRDLFLNNVPELIMGCSKLEVAASVFHRELPFYANKHMPVKTKLLKSSSKPFITNETKELIKAKHQSLLRHRTTRDPDELQTYKRLSKKVQKQVALDRRKNLEKDLQPETKPKQAWRQAKQTTFLQKM